MARPSENDVFLIRILLPIPQSERWRLRWYFGKSSAVEPGSRLARASDSAYGPPRRHRKKPYASGKA